MFWYFYVYNNSNKEMEKIPQMESIDIIVNHNVQLCSLYSYYYYFYTIYTTNKQAKNDKYTKYSCVEKEFVKIIQNRSINWNI